MNVNDHEHLEVHTTESDRDIRQALGRLVFASFEGNTLYRAGEPGYPYFFYRDSSDAALLLDDMDLRKANIAYAAKLQGTKYNLFTGEEPGKIPHEKHHTLGDITMPNGLSTSFNACDTTALFLKDIALVAESEDQHILKALNSNIQSAIRYIQLHVVDGLFYEDPVIVGHENYGLKVTYWKDSVLNDPQRIEPFYPVVYAQAHFQNADALLAIGQILHDEELMHLAQKMFISGIDNLWAGNHFVTAIDAKGIIDPISCDSLLSLLYIPPSILPEGYAEKIETYMKALETQAGYLPGIKAGTSTDEYHTRFIWTHVQGLHHMAATLHNLQRAQEVSRRVVRYIHPEEGVFAELLDPQDDFKPAGNKLQLWSVAAYKYFSRIQ